jgi:hypothetical protein
LKEEILTYTIRVFDYDAAPHHANDLGNDTVSNFKQAVTLAQQRVRETPHNTGYAILVDNGIFGHMGDNGVVASFVKTKVGVRRRYLREEYRKLLRRSRITGEGLLALYNPELQVWEYFTTSGRGGAALTQVGSTEQFQH